MCWVLDPVLVCITRCACRFIRQVFLYYRDDKYIYTFVQSVDTYIAALKKVCPVNPPMSESTHRDVAGFNFDKVTQSKTVNEHKYITYFLILQYVRSDKTEKKAVTLSLMYMLL